MPELPEQLSASSPPLALLARIRTAPGIVSLVAEAEATWRARASAAGGVGFRRGHAGLAGV